MSLRQDRSTLSQVVSTRPARAVATLVTLAALAALTGGCQKREELGWQPVPREAPRALPLPDADARENLAQDRLPPDPSTLWFMLALPLSVGVLLAWSTLRALQAARLARLERAYDPRAPLADGPAVVFGTVDCRGAAPPISVRIVQRGEEHYHKSWRTTWTEVSRTRHVAPFDLVTADGVRVRVEPPQDVALRDDLSSTERKGRDERVRVAEVRHGEKIFVVGALRGVGAGPNAGESYRGGSRIVLGPIDGTRMTVCTEKPGEVDTEQMVGHRVAALALAAWVAFASGALFPSFLVLKATGRVQVARAEQVGSYRVWIRPRNAPGYWQTRFVVRARVGSQLVQDEVSHSLHRSLRTGEYTDVPFLLSSAWPSVHQYGTSAMVGVERVVLGCVGSGVALMLYWGFVTVSVPWYRKRKLVDSVSGRL